jgi:electron transfer flavoprotein beta subunit
MRIIVQLKQIVDPRGISVNRRAGRVFFNRMEHVINPADLNALEAALQIKDAAPETEIYVMACGPERCEAALREALGMGADYGVRLCDPGEASDAARVARVLTAGLRRAGTFDLVLLGERALDMGAGETGARVAHALGLPLVEHSYGLSVADGRARPIVRTPLGYVTLDAPLPAVVTVAHGANRPRYPHAPRLMRAYAEWTIDYWNEAQLGLDETVPAAYLTRGEPEAPPEVQRLQAREASELAPALRPYLSTEPRQR